MWECKECYVSNKSDVENCVACNSPKNPNAPKPAATSSSNFSFGTGGISLTATENTSKFSFGVPPPEAASGFKFANAGQVGGGSSLLGGFKPPADPKTSTTGPSNIWAPQNTDEGKKSTSVFSFGDAISSKPNTPVAEAKPAFSFGNLSSTLNKQEMNANVFDSSNKPATPVSIFGGVPKPATSGEF